MQNHYLRGQKNPHVNKHGQGRKNVGNGLAKLVLFPSGTKLAQSSTGRLNCIYRSQNTDACLGICAKQRHGCI